MNPVSTHWRVPPQRTSPPLREAHTLTALAVIVIGLVYTTIVWETPHDTAHNLKRCIMCFETVLWYHLYIFFCPLLPFSSIHPSSLFFPSFPFFLSHNCRGVVGMLVVFILIGMIHMPGGPFIRPHPGQPLNSTVYITWFHIIAWFASPESTVSECISKL